MFKFFAALKAAFASFEKCAEYSAAVAAKPQAAWAAYA